MCCQPVKDEDNAGVASRKIGYKNDDGNRYGVERYYRESVHHSHKTALSLVSGFFQKEGDGHWYHREDTRGEKSHKTPEYCLQNGAPKRFAALRISDAACCCSICIGVQFSCCRECNINLLLFRCGAGTRPAGLPLNNCLNLLRSSSVGFYLEKH